MDIFDLYKPDFDIKKIEDIELLKLHKEVTEEIERIKINISSLRDKRNFISGELALRDVKRHYEEKRKKDSKTVQGI